MVQKKDFRMAKVGIILILDFRIWNGDFEFGNGDFGFEILDFGFWILDLRTANCQLRTEYVPLHQ